MQWTRRYRRIEKKLQAGFVVRLYKRLFLCNRFQSTNGISLRELSLAALNCSEISRKPIFRLRTHVILYDLNYEL